MRFARPDLRDLRVPSWSSSWRVGEPGDTVRLGRAGGTVDVRVRGHGRAAGDRWLEPIHDGAVIASTDAAAGTEHLELTERVRVSRGGWLAATASPAAA